MADARRRLANALRPRPIWLSRNWPEWKMASGCFRLQQASLSAEAKRLHGVENCRQLTRAQAAPSRWPIAAIASRHRRRTGKRLADAGPFGLALIAAAADMGRAAESLDLRETGAATRTPNRGAIRRLDLLLEALQVRTKTEQSSTAASQPKATARKSASPSGADASSAAQKPGQPPSAANSSRPPDESQMGKSNTAADSALMKRLWGVLPKRAREQMQVLPVEEFPPKYERQIEDYFRRLADEGREDRGERRGEGTEK